MLLLLILFVFVEAMILVLDLLDFRATRQTGVERSSTPAVAFMLLVIVVFLVIQMIGSSLLPNANQIFESLQSVSARYASGGRASEPVSGGPLAMRVVFLFLIAGFWDYLVHRMFSHSRWFWCTHEYHHLPKQVSVVMPGILVRPFAFIPGFLTTFATGATLCLVCLACGLDWWNAKPVIPVLLFIVVIQTASHSRFLRRHWRVHRCLHAILLTTPQEHLLHHVVDSKCNYGNFTTLWDRVFGTYADPTGIKLERLPLGLSYDQDFLGTLTLGKCKLTPAMRRRFQVGRFCRLDDSTLSDE